ncbi:AI-2E family transporter [Candidatus Saccharibacteria bacterium]|nr:AI-2E family transporter [Candidatus Saccharibacteria bacterium]
MAKKEHEVTEVSLTISARTVVKVVLLIVGTTLLLAALRKVSHALILIGTAGFLALALNAPVSWVAKRIPGKRRGSRVLGTSLSFILVVVVLTAFIASLIPPIYRQTSELVDNAPQIVRDLRSEDSDVGRIIKKYNLQEQVTQFSNKLSSRLQNVGGSAFSTAGKIGTSAFSVLTILALTFMMLIEGPKWIALGTELTPKRKREHTEAVLNEMYKVVKGYVNGQVVLAAIAALMLLPGLLIFDVSYPVALMGVVFICGLIPMIGHTIGAILVTIVALFTSPLSAIGILAYYILYQQIENYLIQPRLQANTTNMSPLLVFASLVIGVSFGGLFGGLVAIPIAGCLRIFVLDQLHRRDMIDATPVKS